MPASCVRLFPIGSHLFHTLYYHETSTRPRLTDGSNISIVQLPNSKDTGITGKYQAVITEVIEPGEPTKGKMIMQGPLSGSIKGALEELMVITARTLYADLSNEDDTPLGQDGRIGTPWISGNTGSRSNFGLLAALQAVGPNICD